jgi:hypothetical protein
MKACVEDKEKGDKLISFVRILLSKQLAQSCVNDVISSGLYPHDLFTFKGSIIHSCWMNFGVAFKLYQKIS